MITTLQRPSKFPACVVAGAGLGADFFACDVFAATANVVSRTRKTDSRTWRSGGRGIASSKRSVQETIGKGAWGGVDPNQSVNSTGSARWSPGGRATV